MDVEKPFIKSAEGNLMLFAQDVCRSASDTKEQRPGYNNPRRCTAVYKYLIGK